MAPEPLQILGISGSLRAGSLNTHLLHAAIEIAPAGMQITEYTGIGELPHYNAELDGEAPPAGVAQLREAIIAADGLLVVTPEYNYSIPGVLKNAIDWASRPVPNSSLRFKPIASMGAAPGNFGTIRGQLALRQMLLSTESHVVVKPEVHVFHAKERFDEAGRLTDEGTRALVLDLLDALARVVRRSRVE
ncbi:MAG TPA: NAD(P)H-dependent oxidoreductase [Gaiellales bacterium]